MFFLMLYSSDGIYCFRGLQFDKGWLVLRLIPCSLGERLRLLIIEKLCIFIILVDFLFLLLFIIIIALSIAQAIVIFPASIATLPEPLVCRAFIF
jgi:hypothetical protein